AAPCASGRRGGGRPTLAQATGDGEDVVRAGRDDDDEDRDQVSRKELRREHVRSSCSPCPGIARLPGPQNRSSSGNRSCPRCTCIFPYSAQRARVGIALPGLSRPAGSKARLTAKKASRSAGENCTHIELIFSTPTPCSPVMVPPYSTQVSRISAPKRSARSHSPGLLASNRISGCRLPSPAWKTFM